MINCRVSNDSKKTRCDQYGIMFFKLRTVVAHPKKLRNSMKNLIKRTEINKLAEYLKF